MEKGIINKGEKMKKKRKLKSWVWVLIGFILGILYSYLFVCQDLIKSAERTETMALVQTYQEVENEPQKQNKVEITKEYECILDETSCLIKKYADEYGIDYKLAIAISKHETGNYTSYAFKSLNNVGGMMYWDGNKMSLKSYNSLENGIIAFISNLKNNYIDLGLDTIEKIQVKYAPIGINDNGTNQYWVNGVYNYYNLLDK